ncbi:glycosyltransferase [Herbiconiux sp. UC225_62]|uniref:glycosyltransferase n=1 Tax=Herbiconiux sp. UC225_62 TaxID=3350168 RepID=UPI0036D27446
MHHHTPPPVTVSVVIPVKDDAHRLEVCLAALRRQTAAPLEVVVVDNASTDATAAVARAAGARVVREERPGIPAAGAAGYDAALGDVIARLDADSIPPAHWVEAVLSHLRDHPDVLAVTGAAVFSGGPAPLRKVGAALYLGAYYGALAPALGHVPLFGSNFAMRREAWERVRWSVHRHDPELHDDLDLSFHLGAPGRIRYLRGITVQISHRPFTDPVAMVRRFRRGFRTVFVHWPHELPWRRWDRIVHAVFLRRRIDTRAERMSTPGARDSESGGSPDTGRVRWRIRRRRAAAVSAARDDPYAAYQEWVAAGRPALQPADLMSSQAIALPAAERDLADDD